jgi:hypothetical protein
VRVDDAADGDTRDSKRIGGICERLQCQGIADCRGFEHILGCERCACRTTLVGSSGEKAAM